MIREVTGNLLEADADALVNTVNCVGQMGKGLALQFRQAYPDNYAAYARACAAAELQPGRVFTYATGAVVGPRYIINFPTKRHWRGQSRYEDIESGLVALVDEVERLEITSIAVPPLGCGLGGLEWARVREMVYGAFSGVSGVEVLLFPPQAAPAPAARPTRTPRPSMTPARACLVWLLRAYRLLDYRLSQLEVQKLAYFAQEAGERLELRYERGLYGPYADNLSHLLRRTEGHFTRGFTGSREPSVEIELLPGAIEEAAAFLEGEPETGRRLHRVAALIEGFETPLGMELLASVHWVARHEAPAARSAEEALQRVHAWHERKRRLMTPYHIGVTWGRLAEQGWL